MTHVADEEVLEASGPSSIALVGDTEIDMQVATARRFPRSIAAFMRRAQEMATLNTEIAASCIYALPRKENGKQKNIEGPSARLAEICASAWGNLRAEGKVLGHDGEFVTARGTAWDVETNVVIAYEVKRRITTSGGATYNADMIGVTGNAGASIALRNAILKAIPTPFWKPIYNACRKVVAGDAKTFVSRRDGMLHEFGIMGVTEERLCAALGLKGKLDITLDHMATLAGFYTALKDGDTTIEEAFPENGGLGVPQPAQRKSQQTSEPAAATPAPEASTPAAVAPVAPLSAAAPSSVGVIVDVLPRQGGVIIKLDTGFQAAAKDDGIIRGANLARDQKMRVELIVKPPRDPKFAPMVIEIRPVQDEAQS